MILSKRPEVERFLASPDPAVRAVVIHGKDRGGVGERGQTLCLKVAPDLNDPFDVTLLTDSDVEADGAALDDALSAQSMTGGRRLVRLDQIAGRPGRPVRPEVRDRPRPDRPPLSA